MVSFVHPVTSAVPIGKLEGIVVLGLLGLLEVAVDVVMECVKEPDGRPEL